MDEFVYNRCGFLHEILVFEFVKELLKFIRESQDFVSKFKQLSLLPMYPLGWNCGYKVQCHCLYVYIAKLDMIMGYDHASSRHLNLCSSLDDFMYEVDECNDT